MIIYHYLDKRISFLYPCMDCGLDVLVRCDHLKSSV
jgi:hypothetical protein